MKTNSSIIFPQKLPSDALKDVWELADKNKTELSQISPPSLVMDFICSVCQQALFGIAAWQHFFKNLNF